MHIQVHSDDFEMAFDDTDEFQHDSSVVGEIVSEEVSWLGSAEVLEDHVDIHKCLWCILFKY